MTPEIQLNNGKYFNFLDPDPESFDIWGVAHALARVNRYNGQSNADMYSVAQHSVYVSYLVPEEDAFAGLMHDAAEAFIGDVVKPLKILLPDYARIERRIEACIFKKFGLPEVLPQTVKEADFAILLAEQRDIMPKGPSWAPEGVKSAPVKIVPCSSFDAETLFLNRYFELRPGEELF